MKKQLGGARLGSGNKMTVDLHGYERSTHDLSYVWRSTMSPGTLVPFLSEVALPGDTFDINLSLLVNTHPTIGPLFASYKAQLDIFLTPMRLYNAFMHNNSLNVGLKMNLMLLPVMLFSVPSTTNVSNITDIDNAQINPSCILNYLGLRGLGINTSGAAVNREFNAIPLCAYWDIYKQYYANKSEGIGAVIHTEYVPSTVTGLVITCVRPTGTTVLPQQPAPNANIPMQASAKVTFTGWTTGLPEPEDIIIATDKYGDIPLSELVGQHILTAPGNVEMLYDFNTMGATTWYSWRFMNQKDVLNGAPRIVTFPLENIDQARNNILKIQSTTVNYNVFGNPSPYNLLNITANGVPSRTCNQEGLGLKTYQSDLFQNWVDTSWIDGVGGINDITAIDTSSGSFSIDSLILSKKVYNLLNRVAVSGGSFHDWIEAVYDTNTMRLAESPIYMGGMIKEIVFQEVVSQTASEQQPLGTLAGKGTLASGQKGGKVVIHVDEPSYITGIVSLTPRIDYSQGTKWDLHLNTMDDLHKPGLSGIGFQELITEQMAWWDTSYNSTSQLWEQKSAGKQPAWLNYMTNVNRCYGNFAKVDNQMFMTLNRRYEWDAVNRTIADLTTYIDPTKYNFIFAETALDAQNFWIQIGIDMIARRKMSGKLMPNL